MTESNLFQWLRSQSLGRFRWGTVWPAGSAVFLLNRGRHTGL